MDGILFVLLLLSGLFWSTSALSRPYYYISANMSWPEAQSYCRSMYTDLATVDSMGDVNRLINTVNAGYSGSVWIGLKRGTQNRWGWSNGENTTSQYYNWASGQPSQDAHCVTSLSGSWYDGQCANSRYFMCYIGNTTYLIRSAKNWSDAQSYCRQYYTDLPTIHNFEENNQTTKILLSGYHVWIGLFLDSWCWSDKWILFFRHWAAGQPSQSSGSGDCVGMSRTNSGRWSHYSCALQQPFVCHGGPRPSAPTYQFVNVSMTWLDALRYCRYRFSELAAVLTMNDARRLVNTKDLGDNGSVWIGLYGVGAKRWVWSIGDSSVSQDTMWYPGEPSGDGECVRSFNGSWYDESCTTLLPFVCFNESTGFIITETAMTWRDAQSYCRQQHTDLASISGPEQQNLLSNESSLWIGLFLDSWAWSSQWSRFFRNWATDQAFLSSGSSNCAGMSITDSGKWAQYSCNLQKPFICYGTDRLVKNQIVRLKFSCSGKCTLNDPVLQTAMLNEISNKLKSMGLGSDKKLSWRKGQGGEVFHQEIKPRGSSNNACKQQENFMGLV